MTNNSYIVDVDLELKDAGLIAADAAAQVGGSNQILDLGAGFVEGNVIIDVTAVEFGSADELYEIKLQLSTKSDFADTVVDKWTSRFGDAQTGSDTDQNVIGREVMPFNNEHQGTIYRYARLYTDVSGTIATGINYSAFMTKQT